MGDMNPQCFLKNSFDFIIWQFILSLFCHLFWGGCKCVFFCVAPLILVSRVCWIDHGASMGDGRHEFTMFSQKFMWLHNPTIWNVIHHWTWWQNNFLSTMQFKKWFVKKRLIVDKKRNCLQHSQQQCGLLQTSTENEWFVCRTHGWCRLREIKEMEKSWNFRWNGNDCKNSAITTAACVAPD